MSLAYHKATLWAAARMRVYEDTLVTCRSFLAPEEQAVLSAVTALLQGLPARLESICNDRGPSIGEAGGGNGSTKPDIPEGERRSISSKSENLC